MCASEASFDHSGDGAVDLSASEGHGIYEGDETFGELVVGYGASVAPAAGNGDDDVAGRSSELCSAEREKSAGGAYARVGDYDLALATRAHV